MRKILDRIYDIVNKHFPSIQQDEDDRTWEKWLALKNGRREVRDLWELLTANVRDEFKARALTVLLAPSFDLCPFKWAEYAEMRTDNSLLSSDRRWLNTLPERFLPFVSELIAEYFELANDGVINVEIKRTIDNYNMIIVSLLPCLRVDDPQTERLFNQFHLNDAGTYSDPDWSSGYNPFEQLMSAPHIPEYWKILADKRMRNIIASETAGKTKPRRDWELALPRYTSVVSRNANYPHVYSDQLFCSQMQFVLNLPDVDTLRLFEGWDSLRILDRMSGAEKTELRHRFARHLVWNKNNSFTIYSPETRKVAEAVLAEFGDDTLLCKKFEELIRVADGRQQENDAVREKQEQAHNAVMALMS
jgi:hypothetical protein